MGDREGLDREGARGDAGVLELSHVGTEVEVDGVISSGEANMVESRGLCGELRVVFGVSTKDGQGKGETDCIRHVGGK